MKSANNKKFIGIVVAIIAIGIITFLLYNYAMQKTGYIDVSPTEAKKLIDENPNMIIIDVSPVYADGHLPGAVNYPLDDGTLDEAIPNLDPNAMYLVYCHVFSASSSGAQKLIDAGFTNVYRLDGEYGAWIGKGYEIEQ